ncbi:MAG: class I SAM-dependent methyltransferase [Pseudomonadota bacterium]
MSTLDDIYAKAAKKGADALYREWAQDYDADNAAKGFHLPYLIAALVARHVPTDAGPILDAGAGTGLVGQALNALGYDDLTAIDLSPEMLAVADKRGVYRSSKVMTLGQALAFETGRFAAANCVGSFGVGHAPPETLQELARVTRQDGHVIFNVVENTWRAQGFPEVIDKMVCDLVWELVESPEPYRAYYLAEPDLLVRAFVFRVL